MCDFLKLSCKFILESHHSLKTADVLYAAEGIDIGVVIFEKSCENGTFCHLGFDSLHSLIELVTLFAENFDLLL